ncbi:MAG: hypothetical protein J6X79_07635 [Bacteroidales bacterium]|nr:hypothetical protein [Bacteroidales bacterium]
MSCVRRIASWMLLAAYLPLVLLSSVHIHHETVDLHDNCLQCAGHFEVQHNHQCDCQYCHLLSQSYLGQDTEPLVVHIPVADSRPTEIVEKAEVFRHGVCLLRAPPIV